MLNFFKYFREFHAIGRNRTGRGKDMSILKMLGLASGNVKKTVIATGADSVREISRQLEDMEPDKARYLAAFAYLLGRVAWADRNVSPEEAEMMEKVLIEKGHLPVEQAVLIIEIARQQNRLLGHVDNFLVTREFNELASREQKKDLLTCLFAISASDKSISNIEDAEIRQIAGELLLDHSAFIAARSEFREHLDILKKRE